MKARGLQIGLYVMVAWCCMAGESIAQTYHPMPTGPAHWTMARCWYFYPPGWHDLYHIAMDGSDTILYNKVYKKLYHTTHHAPGTEYDSTYTNFLGGMREEGKKVFMISEWLCLDTIERMIYDFNDAAFGDTLFTQVLTNGLLQFIPHIVTGIDEIEVDGELRRRIFLEDENHTFNETWIEGVGSSMGLVYATYWLLTDNSYDLNCFYDGNELSYQNANPTYAFCTAPFPESECDPVITSDGENPVSLQVAIFPNPAFETLYLEGSPEIESVQLFNALGMQLAEIPFAPVMDVSYLPVGMYFLRFRSSVPGQNLIMRIVKV